MTQGFSENGLDLKEAPYEWEFFTASWLQKGTFAKVTESMFGECS